MTREFLTYITAVSDAVVQSQTTKTLQEIRALLEQARETAAPLRDTADLARHVASLQDALSARLSEMQGGVSDALKGFAGDNEMAIGKTTARVEEALDKTTRRFVDTLDKGTSRFVEALSRTPEEISEAKKGVIRHADGLAVAAEKNLKSARDALRDALERESHRLESEMAKSTAAAFTALEAELRSSVEHLRVDLREASTGLRLAVERDGASVRDELGLLRAQLSSTRWVIWGLGGLTTLGLLILAFAIFQA